MGSGVSQGMAMGRRIVLVFAPGASPTYVPLGVASLVSYARGRSDAEVSAVDLNIELWHEVARRMPDGGRMADFMRGAGESFYDAAVYGGHRAIWSACSKRMGELAGEVRAYLRTGVCSAELGAALDEICLLYTSDAADE